MARFRDGLWRALANWKAALQMDSEKVMNRIRPAFSWHLVCTFLLLAATLTASKLTSHRKAESLVEPLESIDQHIAGFVGTDNPPIAERTLEQLRSDSYLTRTYRKTGTQADLLIVYYAQ